MKYPYAAKVKAMREKSAWTQEQLADVSGVSVRTIQRIERGGPASFESLKAIASAFNIDVREFLDAAPSLDLSEERSPVLSMIPDYWHEDSLKLEERLVELRQERNRADQEAQYARSLHLDMKGPIEAAEAVVQRLSAQVSHVERLVERVRAGFPYLERRGFEDAVDAAWEVSAWEVLSEAPVPGTILGHDDAIVRLPVEAQKSYARAVSTQLFERSRFVCVSTILMIAIRFLKSGLRTIFSA
jgi:transcriptional regulator with XRE-family HTH domain